jgi:hypothetical protein
MLQSDSTKALLLGVFYHLSNENVRKLGAISYMFDVLRYVK